MNAATLRDTYERLKGRNRRAMVKADVRCLQCGCPPVRIQARCPKLCGCHAMAARGEVPPSISYSIPNESPRPRRKVKNTKAKGAVRERRSMAILEAAGYACTRAAASLGAFDIIGIGPVDIVLVQVKTNSMPRADEIERMKKFRAPSNAKKFVHRYRDGRTLPEVREVGEL